MQTAADAARKAIEDGKAQQVLDAYVAITQRYVAAS